MLLVVLGEAVEPGVELWGGLGRPDQRLGPSCRSLRPQSIERKGSMLHTILAARRSSSEAVHHGAAVKVAPANVGRSWPAVMEAEGVDFATLH